MDSFNNPAVIWFILGFVFFILEFGVPGLILFFFAVGAWITAILLFFFDFSLNSQLLIFIGSSTLTILLFRRWLKTMILTRKVSREAFEDEFLGKTGVAETFIGPGQNGKIDFKGTTWDAQSSDIIEKGEQVTIIGNESILLIVRSTKQAI